MNPYQVLGISNNANRETIRKAYLNQAMKWHPDKNPNDREKATIKFKEVNDAYEKLSKEPVSEIDLDSIINSFFGYLNKKGKVSSGNILIDVNVTLENLYCGTECLIEYKRKIIDDSIGNDFCKSCNGYGYKAISRKTSSTAFINDNLECEDCLGTGFSGSLIGVSQEMNIKVPPKTPDDEKLVFKNCGHQKLDGTYGDLIVQLVNFKHNSYKRNNDDLYTTVNISFRDAMLGFEKTIKRLDETSFVLKVKGPVKIGKVITLKGYGMTSSGSMIINIKFNMPKKLNQEQYSAIKDNFN